jgi:2-dehydropantoate 2-reductase
LKVAVMGAGSLGTIIGALISEGGQEVDLIDINQEHVDKLNADGAKITGFLDKTIPVSALLPTELHDKYDLVFLLTKQVYTHTSLTQLLPHLHPESIVCTLQNGIPEEYVASFIGKERTLGGAVGFGATWIGPGVSELTTEWEIVRKYAFDIGEIDGRITSRLHKTKEILDLVGHCEISTNILGIKWSKLLMNATFSGMSAALGCTFGDILRNEKAMKSLAHIADETIKVAHALGIRMETMQGKDMEFLELSGESGVEDKMDFYQDVWSPHKNLKASMLQDLEKKKKTEIDFINGFVSKKGKEYGVKTPYNDMVIHLVKEAETGKMPQDFQTNLSYFDQIQSFSTK